MPNLRDMLNAERTDNLKAADAAAHGQTITGLRTPPAKHEPLYGKPVEPIKMAAAPSDAVDPRMAFVENRAAGRRSQQKRVPFGGAEYRLSYPTRDGYRRYWFNDTPGRLHRAQQAGYSHVIDPNMKRPVCRVTGRQDGGTPLISYLMEIPLEWYYADMAVQQTALEETLSDIREGRHGPGAGDGRYIPKEGISFGGRRTA